MRSSNILNYSKILLTNNCLLYRYQEQFNNFFKSNNFMMFKMFHFFEYCWTNKCLFRCSLNIVNNDFNYNLIEYF